MPDQESSSKTRQIMTKPKFFTDTHVARPVTVQLRLRGIEIVRCEEVGLATAPDPELLAYAASQNLMMLSCDEDFRILHYKWMEEGKAHSGIILFDQQDFCHNIGRMIKAVANFFALVMGEHDWVNELIEGKDHEE